MDSRRRAVLHDGSIRGAAAVYAARATCSTIWRDEFDAAYADGGLFQLTMHPHVIGHRSRIAILRELIEHIRQRGDVWFATHRQVAEYVKSAVLAGTNPPTRDASYA